MGLRSGKYAAELRREGADARNLAGSILAWVRACKPYLSCCVIYLLLYIYMYLSKTVVHTYLHFQTVSDALLR